MLYPPAPWQLHGQLWLSLFRVRHGDHPDREPGVYGVALVSYETPSPLTYSELLVATPRHRRAHVRGSSSRRSRSAPRGPRVEIVQIWVDSVDSRDGGRELWAIPKDLADFRRETSGGLVQRTRWDASLDGSPIASARFTDVSRAMVRTPFRGATWQTRQTGEEVVAPVVGSTKALPCRGSWHFDAQGPLAWLAGKRPLVSVRATDFQMSFG